MSDNYITYARFKENDFYDSFNSFYALLNELETRYSLRYLKKSTKKYATEKRFTNKKYNPDLVYCEVYLVCGSCINSHHHHLHQLPKGKTIDESAISFVKLYPKMEHTVLQIFSMNMKHNHVIKEVDVRLETIRELKEKMENLLINSTNDTFEKYVVMFQQMFDESHDEPLDFCQVQMGDSNYHINPPEASSDFNTNKIESSEIEASINSNYNSCKLNAIAREENSEDLGSFSAIKSTISTSLIDKMNSEMSNTSSEAELRSSRRTRKQTQKVIENLAVEVEKKSIVPHNLLTSVEEKKESVMTDIFPSSNIPAYDSDNDFTVSVPKFQNQSKVAKKDTTKLSHLLPIKRRTAFKNLSDQKKALFILKSFSIEPMAIESALSNEYVIGTSDLKDGLRVTQEGILNMEENFLSVINDKVDAEVLSLIVQCYKDNKSKEVNCLKCNDTIKQVKFRVMCSFCLNYFHINCTPKKTKKTKDAFLCNFC